MSTKNTYNKQERLKSKKAIDALFSSGKVINESPVKAFYALNGEGDLQVGMAVPKRNIKKAVDRNLIKRRMREAYRLNNQALKLLVENKKLGLDIMFVYNSQQILTYQELEGKIKVILKRLSELSEFVDR